jgi:hypothetical protein
MAKKNAPRRLGTGDGAGITSSSDDVIHNSQTAAATLAFLSRSERLPPGWRRFFLHVAEDGVERRFHPKPRHLPSLGVITDGKLEITATYDTVQRRAVEPRGSDGNTPAISQAVRCGAARR